MEVLINIFIFISKILISIFGGLIAIDLVEWLLTEKFVNSVVIKLLAIWESTKTFICWSLSRHKSRYSFVKTFIYNVMIKHLLEKSIKCKLIKQQ